MKFTVTDFYQYLRSVMAIVVLTAFDFSPASQTHPLFSKQSNSFDENTKMSFFKLYNDFDSINIPLKRAGRLIMVEANIDGIIGNLIFDTGATGLVLNKTYFRDHVVNDNLSSKGITGSLDMVEGITVNLLTISDLSFKKVTANLTNLGHIENRRGVKVLGLFGFNLFRGFEIIIDIHNGSLFLHKIDKKGNRVNSKTGFVADHTQNIEIKHNIVFLKGVIGGKTLRFCFDTGAETNAISTDAPKAVLKTIIINRKSNLNGAGSQTNQVLFGTMNDFVFGSTQLHNMETILTNLEYLNDAYEGHIDGVLGYNFLIKGIICINFEKNQMGISFTKSGEL